MLPRSIREALYGPLRLLGAPPYQVTLEEEYTEEEASPNGDLQDALPLDNIRQRLDKEIRLPHQVSIIIPTNTMYGDPIDPKILENILNLIKSELNERFGGFTSTSASGGYKGARDEGEMIFTNVSDEDLAMATSFMKELGLQLKEILDQESIGIMVNDEMILV